MSTFDWCEATSLTAPGRESHILPHRISQSAAKRPSYIRTGPVIHHRVDTPRAIWRVYLMKIGYPTHPRTWESLPDRGLVIPAEQQSVWRTVMCHLRIEYDILVSRTNWFVGERSYPAMCVCPQP